jgi:parallel beta-helix repeat protein
MKRHFLVGAALVGALIFGSAAQAGQVLVVDDDGADCPNADFASIQAAVTAAAPGTRIMICEGTYTEEVVIAGPAKAGLQLIGRGRGEDVVLDGLLGTAAPTGYNGIELSNVTDVVLRNFTVTRFHENIYLLPGANENTVTHMIARGPSAHDGIRLDNAHRNLIEHNEFFRNGVPPRGCGVDLLLGSSDNRIVHNTIYEQDRAGVRLLGAGTGNVVAHNRSTLNGNGVFLQNTSGSLIEHNFLEQNFAQGDQRGVGIRMLATTAATGNTVRFNHVGANQSDGIALENADDNVISNNSSDDNGRDGIRSDAAASGNLFERNHMFGNVEHDAHDDNRAANTWVRNHCATDFPPGTICDV